MVDKKQKKQLIFFSLAVLWGMLIFYLSSTPNLSSGLPSTYDLILRKTAHVVVFMVLTYLIASSFDSHNRRYLLFVIVVAVVYAFIDELHQVFVVTRSGNPTDIIIDSVGVYFGIWLYKHQPPNKLFKKFIK